MNAAMPEKTKIWVEIKSAVPYINKWALMKPRSSYKIYLYYRYILHFYIQILQTIRAGINGGDVLMWSQDKELEEVSLHTFFLNTSQEHWQQK